MRTDGVITLWHFDKSSGTWTGEVFLRASIDIKQKIDKNGIKQKGFYDASGCVIRIPVTKEIKAVPGDYVYIGRAWELEKDESLKVTEVSDNRKGGSPHWRISCGGKV